MNPYILHNLLSRLDQSRVISTIVFVLAFFQVPAIYAYSESCLGLHWLFAGLLTALFILCPFVITAIKWLSFELGIKGDMRRQATGSRYNGIAISMILFSFVGTVVGMVGAVKIWGWTWMEAIALFHGLSIAVLLYFIASIASMSSSN